MSRRSPYSKVRKRGQDRPEHVQGKGDVVFKVFQCLARSCESWIVVPVTEIAPGFRVHCPACRHELSDGEATPLYSYDLVVGEDVEESGHFEVDHGEYVRRAPDYKYCIVCYTLKPLAAFARHRAREQSGRQGECTSCKTTYNSIKNKTRMPEQHREASDRRRILGLLGGDQGRIDITEIRGKFAQKCFACDTEITEGDGVLDHTLPARYLWNRTTENATLLCATCNGQKAARWPSEFYDDEHLRKLALLTGFPYDLLAGTPAFSVHALAQVREDPDTFLAAWIHRPKDIKALRTLAQEIESVDILENATHVPDYLN